MKEAIAEEVLNNLKVLKHVEENGHCIGKLKFVSAVRSIALKQFNVTFKFVNEQRTKIRIQGCKQAFCVLGAHQIPQDAQIKIARIVKKPSGYYFHVTCFVEKDGYIESWERTRTKKFQSKIRQWTRFDKPVGIDFKPNGLVLSNGISITWTVPETTRLKKLQRKLSRQQKGLKRYNRTKQKLAREYERISN